MPDSLAKPRQPESDGIATLTFHDEKEGGVLARLVTKVPLFFSARNWQMSEKAAHHFASAN